MRALAEPFVGRDLERTELVRLLQSVRRGRRGLALLVGEPGIGKTRLLEEVLGSAEADDMAIVEARCWDAASAPAFWPWIRLVRRLAGLGYPPPPALSHLLAESDQPVLDGPSARNRLYDGVIRYLESVTDETPLVFLVDDAQEADDATIDLLTFVARQLGDARMAILATARHGPAAEKLAGMGREGSVIELHGLGVDDVAELLAGLGEGADAARAAEVHRATGGNPFFVAELARWNRSAAPGAVPGSVEHAIAATLETLDGATRTVLGAAAVMGNEFRVRDLATVVGPEAGPAIDGAISLGFCRADQERPGFVEFAHGLLRETLYSRLSTSDRLALHDRVASALDDHTGDRTSEVAYHAFRAASLDPERAIVACLAAARAAEDQLAYEVAVHHFEDGCAVMDGAGETASVRRGEVHLRLSELKLRTGAIGEWIPDAERAAAIARRAGDHVLLARAALSHNAMFGGPMTVKGEAIGVLEDALAAVGHDDPTLRASLLATLALQLFYATDRARARRTADEAVALAGRTDDREVMRQAALARLATRAGDGAVAERSALADGLVELEQQLGRPPDANTWELRIGTLVEAGDFVAVDDVLAELVTLEDRWRVVAPLWRRAVPRYRLMRSLLEGPVAAAEARLGEALEAGLQPEATGGAFFLLHWLRGDLAPLEDAARQFTDQYPAVPVWRAALALLLAEMGKATEAGAVLSQLAATGFDTIADSDTGMAALAMVARAIWKLRDPTHAAGVLRAFGPGRRGHWVPVGFAGALCLGPVQAHRGLVAALAGEPDADDDLAEAIESSRRSGANLWLAISLADRADVLDLIGGDQATARRLRSEAASLAHDLGLTRLDVPPVAPNSDPAPEPARFALVGDYWEVEYQGRAVRLRDRLGLGYIARLLARPGHEIHVAELAGISTGRDEGTGPLLDDQAKAAYLERLRDLEDEADKAGLAHDTERAARATAEIDALHRELAAAFGLGGRARPTGSPVERARQSVTKAVKAAIATVVEAQPALGEHLLATIRTGTFCVYQPDPRAVPAWSLAAEKGA